MFYLLNRKVSRNPKLSQHPPVLLDLVPRKLLYHELHGADAHVELVDVVLGEVAKLEVPVRVSVAGRGGEFVHDDLEQGSLASAVLSHLEKMIRNIKH
jgi:hypothetical protein